MNRGPTRNRPTTPGWFLVGAPWDSAGTGRAEAHGPSALRAAGVAELTEVDLGDADTRIDSTTRDPATGVLALPETVRAATALSALLVEGFGVHPGRRPLVVGGDCSLLLGVMPALRARYGRVGLWIVDGHPDFSDGHGSATGETADLELTVLTGDGPEVLTGLGGDPPLVAPEDVVLLGHRTVGLDPEAQRELNRVPAEIRRIDAGAVARAPRRAGERAREWLSAPGLATWLHLDLDVLDPRVLPAVTYPQAGGPDWTELADLLAPLAGAQNLVGISVADLRPDLDPRGTHARAVVRQIAALLDGAVRRP